MRTWMKLIPAVLVALPFTWSSLHAEDKSNDQKIADLQKEVGELRKEIAQLRKDLTDNAAQRSALSEQLRSIDRTLNRLVQDEERISRYGPQGFPPGGPPIALRPTATGTITLRNSFLAPATVRINGQSFIVRAGETIPIRVPTGTFQYSVDVEGYGTVEPLRTDNLPAAGYRITIFPRMMF